MIFYNKHKQESGTRERKKRYMAKQVRTRDNTNQGAQGRKQWGKEIRQKVRQGVARWSSCPRQAGAVGKGVKRYGRKKRKVKSEENGRGINFYTQVEPCLHSNLKWSNGWIDLVNPTTDAEIRDHDNRWQKAHVLILWALLGQQPTRWWRSWASRP